MKLGMVSFEKPSLFLFGFLVIVSYVPGIIGAAIPTGWFALMFFVPIFLCFYKINFTIWHLIGSLFLSYCCLSLGWTYNLNIGFFSLLQILILGAVFCLGSALTDLKFILYGFVSGLGISDIIAIGQKYFHFDFIFTVPGNIAGLFVNQDLFCQTSAILLVTLTVFKLWWWLPITLPGLILVHSRAAYLALCFCFVAWLWTKSKIVAISVIGFACLFVAAYYSSDAAISERFSMWEDTARGFNLFGHGIGSFEALYPLYAVHVDTILARPRFAHNDLWQAIFEFGIGTIFLIIFVIGILSIRQNERYILYAVSIISLFSFPFHIPAMAFIGCLVAGYITRFNDTDGYFGWCRRPVLFKWCSNA